MIKKSVLVILSACFISGDFAHAGDIESQYKDVCSRINKEAVASMDPTGAENAVSEKQVEENFNRQRKLFEEWQVSLKRLIQADPASIWADDAQYIVCVLSAENPEAQAKEFELLIEKYPDARIEPWTSKVLAVFIPSEMPILVDARAELIAYYKKIGSEEKAKANYEEAVRKYPVYEKRFMRAYGLKPFSKEDIERAKKRYDESLETTKKQ